MPKNARSSFLVTTYDDGMIGIVKVGAFMLRVNRERAKSLADSLKKQVVSRQRGRSADKSSFVYFDERHIRFFVTAKEAAELADAIEKELNRPDWFGSPAVSADSVEYPLLRLVGTEA